MKNIFSLKTSKSRMILLFIVDVITIIVNSYLALIVRYKMDGNTVPVEDLASVNTYLLINIVTTMIIFLLLNLYNRVWSYASLYEALLVCAAAILSTAFQAFGMSLLYLTVPRSFHLFYFFFLTMTTLITRFSYRILHALQRGISKNTNRPINTMVIGAGEAGNIIITEMKTSKHLNRNVVCVIDDNPSKTGKYIRGVRIVGDRTKIKEAAKKYDVDEIMLAIPSADNKDTRDILRICNETTCKLKVLPGVYQLINDEVSVSKLREVSIEDLLGRDTVKIDIDSIAGYVRGKSVLVTGGGGSIGSELCRQIAAHNPRMLIIFDIYENNAYDIQQELKKKYPKLRLEVLIGSVRNTKRIESVMDLYRPDVVYHAAAHKHVPLMEDSPNEAIKNNVFGTLNVAKAADQYGVKKFILISTDKAVNPTNIMGASKRLCEMIVQSFDKKSKTEFVAVRFGNVLGSNGSVIPLFKKQIKEGGPITITHPDIIRYFMTIPEAVSLVLQAGAYAKGGEIFVLDMGAPVKIDDLAKNLIRLSGYTLGVDMNIEYTGLRPGEKLYEELLMDEEGLQDTENKLIHIGKPIVIEDKMRFYDSLIQLKILSYSEIEDIRPVIMDIVPTFHPNKH
jgi:FlaA1/EpsC-like NDP-sugar epimerase